MERFVCDSGLFVYMYLVLLFSDPVVIAQLFVGAGKPARSTVNQKCASKSSFTFRVDICPVSRVLSITRR